VNKEEAGPSTRRAPPRTRETELIINLTIILKQGCAGCQVGGQMNRYIDSQLNAVFQWDRD